MIVADTHLIASLLLATPCTAAAEAVLQRDPDWTAPNLWRYEFKNVLTTQVRVMGLSLDRATALFKQADVLILDPELEVVPADIFRLASSKKLSAYDAEFLGLALALGRKLVTRDGAILKAAPGIAITPEAFLNGPPI